MSRHITGKASARAPSLGKRGTKKERTRICEAGSGAGRKKKRQSFLRQEKMAGLKTGRRKNEERG